MDPFFCCICFHWSCLLSSLLCKFYHSRLTCKRLHIFPLIYKSSDLTFSLILISFVGVSIHFVQTNSLLLFFWATTSSLYRVGPWYSYSTWKHMYRCCPAFFLWVSPFHVSFTFSRSSKQQTSRSYCKQFSAAPIYKSFSLTVVLFCFVSSWIGTAEKFILYLNSIFFYL